MLRLLMTLRVDELLTGQRIRIGVGFLKLREPTAIEKKTLLQKVDALRALCVHPEQPGPELWR
jgi:hypothetical protein